MKNLSASVLVVLAILFAGPVSLSAQVQKAGSAAASKSAVINRAFDLTSQGRETVELEITAAGKIEAKATWTGTAERVALILNGPDRTQYYARKDGRSPLTLSFDFDDSHLAKGGAWRLSVALFGEGTAKGRVEVRLPGAPAAASGTPQVGKAKSETPGRALAKGKTKETPAVSVAEPTIRVTAPTPRTELIAGERCRVRWASTGEIGKVNLWMEYIDRTGQVTVMQLPGIGNDMIPNSGSRLIDIPGHWTSANGERWRVKIASGGIVARSEDLTIARKAATGGAAQSGTGGGGPASIDMTAPAANAVLIAGEPFEVRWSSTGIGDSVMIGYEFRAKNTARSQFVAVAMAAPNTGSYRVTLPPSLNSRFYEELAVVVRSSGAPEAPMDRVTVSVYPRVSLSMIPVTEITGQESSKPTFTRYWRPVLHMRLDFNSYGIEDLDRISAKLQFFDQATDRLVAEGTVSKQGTFMPGPHTVEIEFNIGGWGVNGQKIPSGHYRVHIQLFDPREPEELRSDNTKIVFFEYHD